MDAAAAIVIRCADASARVWTTLRSAERQTVRAEVALVADPSTPASTAVWLRAVAESRGHRFVQAESDRAAAVKNAGIGAVKAPIVACVDAGWFAGPVLAPTDTAAELTSIASAVVTKPLCISSSKPFGWSPGG